MEKRVFNANFLKGTLFAASAALLCAALLTCSNAAGGSDAPVSQKDSPLISSRPGYVILNGTVNASGAVPQILADTPDSSENENDLSRSARPGIDASGADATMEYFATATCDGLEPVNGVFGTGADAKKFGIELAASKTWSVVVGVRSKTADAEGNKKIYLQSKPWSVTPDPADPTISRNFVPVPIVTSAGKGTIELAVNYIHSVFDTSARFVSGPSGYDSLPIISSTEGNDQIYKVLNVPSGTYELCIDIMEIQDGNKFLVYSSIQTVSVADGMTTNAWVSDGSGIIDSNGTFKFNDSNATALKQSYLSSNIYVGKYSDESNSQIADASDTNSGNWMAPLASINQAVNRINSAGKSNIDYVVHLNGKIQSDDLNNTTRITASTVTATHAKSITIVGTTGPSKDILEATKQGTPALMVTTSVPIIVKNIKLDGYSGAGSSAALDASGGAKVTIESGVEIADADLGVRVADTGSDGTTVTMKGGTISGNVTAVDLQGGDFILQGGSIPYDSANKKNYVKTASEKFVTAKGDLAAVDASGGKIAIEPAQKKRGVKLVDVSAATASDADIEAKFMVYDPTISAENPSGDEWQLVSAAADRALKTNAPIYVGQDPNGYAGSNDNPGTKSAPYYEIKRACEDMDDADMPYTINVRGKLPAQTIPDTLSKASNGIYKAKSVLIKGVNPIPTSGADAGIPQDQIQVGLGGTAMKSALTVASAVPITIQNLKITKGLGTNGGGLYLNSGTEVHLESGVLITDNTAINEGGGVYCAGGKLFINEGAKICGNHVSPSSGNYGGIGLYANSSAEITMTGGEISGNKDTSHVDVVGGGVKLEGSASFAMSGGEVKDNQVVRAGGNFYVTGGDASGPSVTLSGSAKITGGLADSSSFSSDQDAIGGAVWLEGAGSSLEMSGGEISGNQAKSSSDKNACAGIYVSGATFTMTGGKISGNNVLGGNIQGGAVRLNGKFNISGSAYIPYGNAIGKNDVYLCDGKTVTIAAALNPPEGVTKVAAITPSVFKRGTNILDGTAVLLSQNKEKFSVSQDDADWNKVGENIAGQYFVRINSPVYVVGAEGTGSTKPDGFGWGQTTGATGTKGHPFASVSAALSVLETGAIDEITIAGLLKGAQTISGTFPSFTLKGYGGSSLAVINAGGASGAGSALTVDASGKTVTIQDLTITGGNATNGGGINLAAGTVNLESGAKVSSNKATSGGSGAGVYVASGATLNIKDGSAIFSNSEYSGTITGAGVYNSGTVNMSGGSVYSNTAYNGGGIYNSGTLSMTGGAIGGSGTLNSATNLGGAIYQAGTFNVSGGAFVYSGTEKSNDVYLASEKYITISANDLSSTTVATITPSSWGRGMQVLYATTDSWITSNYSRFKVSDAEWNVGYYGAATADNAKRIGADLWVAGTGYASGVCATKTASDSNRGTKKQPYASIKKAAEQCWTTGKAFTINISGMITGATQEIPAANSTAGTTLASKITLTGLTGNTKDGINRNLAGSTAVDGGSALIINYQGYVDMTNLKIMGGNTTGNGGGIQINGPTTFSTTACPRVNLKSGVLIQQNQAVKGGGIYSSKAILCLSGTATVGNDGALDRSASNTAISNNINIATTAGGGIYNYNGYLYLGGAWVADAINTSGYNLTKGVYANVCSYSGTDDNSKNQAAGGIYNFGLFYMMNGNVSYNYGVNTGGVYSSTGTNAEFAMQGGKIHKNAGSGVYNAASSNFCMSGDAVIGDVDTVASSSTACSNNKGGLVNYGTARLGYSHGTTKAKLSGGIYGNYRSAGSGISHQSGTIYFDSGTIANNYNTGSGGGIYAKGAVYMTSSSSTQYSCITNNKAKNGGGIFLSGTSAKLFMSGYAIIGTSGNSAPPSSSTATGINYASTSGGGIYAESGPTIYLGYSKWSDGGTSDQATLNGGVCYNYATKSGGGIYCNAASSYPITIYINSGSINANKVYYASGDTTYGLGGGIYANSYTTIYMGGGQISKNSAMNYGGGVYTAGALFMYGSALIGDTNTSTTTTTESNYSNCAKAGGGVYVTSTSGTLALGYDGRNGSDYFEQTLTGGIKHNFATGETTSSTDLTTTTGNSPTPVGIGGGVYMTGSYFYMKSGTIGYNKAYDGAGLAITHSVQYPTVYDGGSITYNSARRNGGGVAVHANSYVLIKGSVTYNTAASNGGGFYLTEGGNEEYGTGLHLEDTSGKISNNTATNGNGGGVCSAGGSFSVSGGATMAGNYAGGNGGAVYGTRLQLNGVASIPGTSGHIGQTKYNDIYSSGITAIWLTSSALPAGAYFSNMYITLPSGLSSSDITNYRIVSYSYTAPDPGLASYSKFYLTQSSPYYTTKKIGEYGYLVNQ